MSELNNGFWLKPDGFFSRTAKNTEKINKGLDQTVFLRTTSALGTLTPIFSRLKNFSQKVPCVKNQHKSIQPSILICLSLVVKVSL